jgi:hypothetical protein
MKKLVLLALALILFIGVNAQKTKDEAIIHNDVIVDDEIMLLDMDDLFISSVTQSLNAETVECVRGLFLDYIDNRLEKYEKMDAFDEQDVFRKAIIVLLTTYKSVVVNEYVTIVELYAIPTEEYLLDEENYDLQWDETVESLDKKTSDAISLFLEEQVVYAEQYGFTLTTGSSDDDYEDDGYDYEYYEEEEVTPSDSMD